jgi:hypothetical protein
VRSDGEPWDLLRRAGFTDIEVTDVTGEFLATARGWFAHASRLERDLRLDGGERAFEERQADRRQIICAIEDGLLSRALIVGMKPGGGHDEDAGIRATRRRRIPRRPGSRLSGA